jgi:putative sugar O-methyltransferase
MHKYTELAEAIEDMNAQSELYRPTSFWSNASQRIVDELNEQGIERFRRFTSTLSFFVPTYGLPGNCFTKELVDALTNTVEKDFPDLVKAKLGLKQFLIGEMWAHSDFSVIKAADIESNLPYLHLFSESSFGQPVEQFEFENRKFSRSSLNYLLGLSMLKKQLKGYVPETVMEIGGGFGTLGEILSTTGIKNLRYIDVDIPPTSFVAQHYLTALLGEDKVATYKKTKTQTEIQIANLPTASVLCSWQIEKLVGKIDLFVNFISFQEMEPKVVHNYLSHVSRLKADWILLRNMKEGKNVKTDTNSVGVEIPILSEDYLTMLPDYQLVDRNIVPFGYRTVDNFHSELLLLKRIK